VCTRRTWALFCGIILALVIGKVTTDVAKYFNTQNEWVFWIIFAFFLITIFIPFLTWFGEFGRNRENEID
jgi:predicted tellurium resistance membrane protein TerC